MKTLTMIQALATLAALGSAILGSATPADASGGGYSFAGNGSFARPSFARAGFARPGFGRPAAVFAARQQFPAVIAAQNAHPGHVNPGSTSNIVDTPNGQHGFDYLDDTDESREAVERAFAAVLTTLTSAAP